MDNSIWIGIFGTVVALAFILNSMRNLRVSLTGHAANAGRLHIIMAIAFMPVMWLVIMMRLL